MSKKVILTFSNYYLPAFRGGGPIRTLSSMVDKLSDRYQFKIITTDRDDGDAASYPGIKIDDWNSVGNALVYYCSPGNRSLQSLARIIRSTSYDEVYLNSVFNFTFTIKPLLLRKLGFFGSAPLLLAPRGEFSKAALAIKARKKTAYLRLARSLRLYDDLLWHASSDFEQQDIQAQFGQGIRVFVAPNLAAYTEIVTPEFPLRQKKTGELRAIFLSRVSPKKNLEWALKVLRDVQGKVYYDIYGPIGDSSYWSRCLDDIATMPSNIQVSYKGEVIHSDVAKLFSTYDILFFPTGGENFGHVILESLAAGCPVLISDSTPWRNLKEAGIGWDLPLRIEIFRKALQDCIDMDDEDHLLMSKRAQQFALKYYDDDSIVQKNIDLFEFAANR